MTIQEAARILGLSGGHVTQLIRQGRLKAKRVPISPWSTRTIYDVDAHDVERFRNLLLNSHTERQPTTDDQRNHDS